MFANRDVAQLSLVSINLANTDLTFTVSGDYLITANIPFKTTNYYIGYGLYTSNNNIERTLAEVETYISSKAAVNDIVTFPTTTIARLSSNESLFVRVLSGSDPASLTTNKGKNYIGITLLG